MSATAEQLGVFDSHEMRKDIVVRLLGGEEDVASSLYLDRLSEICEMENAEHQMLIDPIDRSIALVLQLFQDSSLDPWDIDLESFIDLFQERISESENIDLPSCGRLIRMAWRILHAQTFSLIERHENWDDGEDEFDFDGGWETEFDDGDYNFSLSVLSGAAKDVLPDMFEGRIKRGESRPITLTEMLFSLKDAHASAHERQLREESRIRHRAELEKAMQNVSSRMHREDTEEEIRRSWASMRAISPDGGPVELEKLRDRLRLLALEEGSPESEAKADGEISGFVSALFLTHRGFADIWQMDPPNGPIFIQDKWPNLPDFDTVDLKLKGEREGGGA